MQGQAKVSKVRHRFFRTYRSIYHIGKLILVLVNKNFLYHLLVRYESSERFQQRTNKNFIEENDQLRITNS